jgi:hypothetical protein
MSPKKSRLVAPQQRCRPWTGADLAKLVTGYLADLALPNQPPLDVNLVGDGHDYAIRGGRLAPGQIVIASSEKVDTGKVDDFEKPIIEERVDRLELRFCVRNDVSVLSVDNLDPRTFVWVRPGYEHLIRQGDLLINHVIAPTSELLGVFVDRVERSYSNLEKGKSTTGPGCNVRLRVKSGPVDKKSKKRRKKKGQKVEKVKSDSTIFAELSSALKQSGCGSIQRYDRLLRYNDGDSFIHENLGLCFVQKVTIGLPKMEVLCESGRKVLIHAPRQLEGSEVQS